MKRYLLALAAVAVAGGALLWSQLEGPGDAALQQSYSPPVAELPAAAPVLQPGEKVAFLELGSVGCKPCEAMKPVMRSVRERYPTRVDVVFHDVKKNPGLARQHGILLIPTQIFLLPDGGEFFRHEGFFPLDEVEKVLGRMGVR